MKKDVKNKFIMISKCLLIALTIFGGGTLIAHDLNYMAHQHCYTQIAHTGSVQ